MTESKNTFQPGLISQRKRRHAEEYLFVLGVRRLAGCPLLPPLCWLLKKRCSVWDCNPIMTKTWVSFCCPHKALFHVVPFICTKYTLTPPPLTQIGSAKVPLHSEADGLSLNVMDEIISSKLNPFIICTSIYWTRWSSLRLTSFNSERIVCRLCRNRLDTLWLHDLDSRSEIFCRTLISHWVGTLAEYRCLLLPGSQNDYVLKPSVLL